MVLAGGMLAGCGPKPPVAKVPYRYVRAEATLDPPRPKPIVLKVPEASVPPVQARALPLPTPEERRTGGKVTVTPIEVVQEAHRKAAQSPSARGYFNAVMQYTYEPAALYEVYAAPFRVTDIVLEPGEHLVGQPASGDTVRWVLGLGKSVEKGTDQWHVYLKPTQGGLATNLAINTDRRTYLLELRSYEDAYMAAVKWHYPHDEVERIEAEGLRLDALERNASPVVSLEALDFRYTIERIKGAPRWTPVQVFDDGKKTFIRFPATMLVREAPALFVLRDKETQLVNYRVRGDFYVVDRLFDAAELRVGQQDQEIVRVRRSAPGKE
jgi:type IV secretion system protein VirB9